MKAELILILITVFIFGIIIGSFLNVCIYRIPLKQEVVKTKSHCMKCGYQLKWYDLIPIVSYLMLKGKCHKCNTRISIQYPFIELINGVLYIIIFLMNDNFYQNIIYSVLTSILIVIFFIDMRTFEIPFSLTLSIFILGILTLFGDIEHWLNYVIGFFSVSILLLLLYVFSKGKAIGGGDIKMMAACGLVLGWKLNILAFLTACILASIIHLVLMKIKSKGSVLALGPYLAVGVYISALWGEELIRIYLKLL